MFSVKLPAIYPREIELTSWLHGFIYPRRHQCPFRRFSWGRCLRSMMFCRRALHPQPVQFYFHITPLYARQGFPWPERIPKNIPARAASCETYSKKHTCRKCKISSNAVQRKRQNLKNASSVIAKGLFHRFAARNEEVHIWQPKKAHLGVSRQKHSFDVSRQGNS